MEPKKLFNEYFKVGFVTDFFKIKIDNINSDTLEAVGTAIDCPGFFSGEKVNFVHVYDEVWRVTSDNNSHGHAVFVGEWYGGVTVGS